MTEPNKNPENQNQQPVVPQSTPAQSAPVQPVQPAPVQPAPQVQPAQQPVQQVAQQVQQAQPAQKTPQKAIIRTQTSKRGTKISPKAFAIGCVSFIALIIILIFVGVYAALKNPGALGGINIPAAQAKTILMIIAGAFFGIGFIVSFGFLLLNGYRLTKAKNTGKGKFIISIIISFFALLFSAGVGGAIITNISKINVTEGFSKNLVVGYVSVYEKGKQAVAKELEDPGITAIGPLQVYMRPNQTFYTVLSQRPGGSSANSLSLACGNGTIVGGDNLLSINGAPPKATYFDAPCLYMKKGTYTLEATYTYHDKATQQLKTEKVAVGTIEIKGEIVITNDGKTLSTNENMTEVLAGDTPARLVFDAKNIFTDLGIRQNLIIWDLNSDGTDESDKENKTFFSYNYKDAGLTTVSYRIPSNSKYPLYYYSFPLRLIQSDVPVCTISQRAGNNGSMLFEGRRQEGGIEVNRMQFEVYNLTQERTVQTLPVNALTAGNPTFSYTLPDNNQYIIRLSFTTLEGKKGFCESETLNANKASYDIQAGFQWKKPQDAQYTAVNTQTLGDVTMKDDIIYSTLTPIDIQVAINTITPQPPQDASINVVIDDKPMQAVKSNIFTSRIYGPNDQRIRIIIDDGKGNISEKAWTIRFNQSALRGSLLATPITGPEPLVVSFNASTITTTDTEDEIVYYSWDFGNGQKAPNITNAKMDHTYYFSSNSGTVGYYPTVTVQTKKGVKQTFELTTPISVTRQASTVTIDIPSHPTQIANVGSPVTFSMSTDGYVTSTTWDFGDGSSEKECSFRSCAQTTKTFTSAGTYTVTVKVDYEGLPSVSKSINIKVE